MTARASGKAKFINPPNVLRQKVGTGGIDPARLQKADEYIENNDVDFIPYASDLMALLNDAFDQVKAEKIRGRDAVARLIWPIMELKANGGMFKYILVSEIAGIALNFMENIDDVNDDTREIIGAHQNALNMIIGNRLQGSGGAEGKALAKELYAACKRYYAKHNIVPRG